MSYSLELHLDLQNTMWYDGSRQISYNHMEIASKGTF